MEDLVPEVGLQCSAAGAQVCVCVCVCMSVYVIVLTSYSLFLAWDISLSPCVIYSSSPIPTPSHLEYYAKKDSEAGSSSVGKNTVTDACCLA